MLKYKLSRVRLDGVKKGYYYGTAIHGSVITTDDLALRIQRNCSMKHSDCLAVLKELEEVMHDSLCNGDIVKLGGIGTFKLSIRSQSVKDPSKFSANDIKKIRVNFAPERYQTSVATETRADGTKVTKKVFTDTLTYGASVCPDSSVATVVKDYESAQAGA